MSDTQSQKILVSAIDLLACQMTLLGSISRVSTKFFHGNNLRLKAIN